MSLSGLPLRLAFIYFSLVLTPTFAQDFRAGFIGGVPITNNFQPTGNFFPGDAFNPPALSQTGSGPRSFLAGLTLEAALNNNLSIEADALHRSYWAQNTTTENPGTSAASTTTFKFLAINTWEFPILLKYTLSPSSRWQPFVDAGISLRSFQNGGVRDPSRYGFTAGAGLAVSLGRFQLTPQLRYTRWADAPVNGVYEFKRDQLEFLTGLSFRTPTNLQMANRRFAIGLLGGLRLNETLAGTPYRLGKRVLAGVSLEANLAHRFSLEADGIYEPIGTTGNSVITWVVPVLAKYRFAVRNLPLFGEAGPSFRASGNLQSAYAPSNFGFTAGVGIEKRVKTIRIAPAFRYTRWANGQGYNGASGATIYNPNSADIVLGVSF